MVKPSGKLNVSKYLIEKFTVSIKRACNLLDLSRSLWYYQSKRDDSELIAKLTELAEQLPTRGFDEYYKRLRREGYPWNRKRVLRVYRSMRLSLRRKHKKRLPARVKQSLEQPQTINQCWSMDFLSDALTDGRKVRVLNVMDDYNREALIVNARLHYPAWALIESLEELKEEIGTPQYISCDNGPEFISKRFAQWTEKNHIEIKYIQPGKPMQNGYIERLNRYYREDVLDAYYFNDLYQLNTLNNKWKEDYNNNHPHKSLGDKSPREFFLRKSIKLKFDNFSEANNPILSNFALS